MEVSVLNMRPINCMRSYFISLGIWFYLHFSVNDLLGSSNQISFNEMRDAVNYSCSSTFLAATSQGNTIWFFFINRSQFSDCHLVVFCFNLWQFHIISMFSNRTSRVAALNSWYSWKSHRRVLEVLEVYSLICELYCPQRFIGRSIDCQGLEWNRLCSWLLQCDSALILFNARIESDKV